LSHSHSHAGPATGRHLGRSVVLTFTFVAGEAAAGFWSNSLALLADAGHNLADALALLLSWWAVRIARRPPTATKTFGYHRVGILTALANALALVVVAVLIGWEAVARLRTPEPVAGGLMIGVAAAAVALNTVIAIWLHREARHDLNVRSAYVHMVGDALSAVGVVIAGIVVAATGSTLADPVVSLLIAGMIVWSARGVLVESVNVLLEAVPKGFDVPALESAIRAVPGVLDVHDLHVWSVSSGLVAASCHVVVAEQTAHGGQGVMEAVREVMHERFHVTHPTVQVEVVDCRPGQPPCPLDPKKAG
jgi:cobalt-zinc-cadmium efflux system protein